jgi:hypothetical protein
MDELWLSRFATEEDWKRARALLDEDGEKFFRLSLAHQVAARAGRSLNAAHIARELNISENTASAWLKKLSGRNIFFSGDKASVNRRPFL